MSYLLLIMNLFVQRKERQRHITQAAQSILQVVVYYISLL